MTWRQTLVALCLLVALFVLGQGALWRDPWDMARVDGAIAWSYAPIPLVVLAVLAWSKKLGWRAFFLDLIRLTFLKYAVTAAIVVTLWAVAGEPPKPVSLASVKHIPVAPDAPLAVSDVPTAERGALSGTVVDVEGRASRGALVSVDSGLEGLVFAPPSEPLSLVNDGTGLSPALAGVMQGQAIAARSGDGALHTLIGTSAEGEGLFNVPLLGSGQPVVVHAGALGRARLHCMVHQRSEREHASTLVVYAHPFFALTDADGRFRIDGVPARPVVLVALSLEGATASASVLPPKGGEARVSLRLSSEAH